MSHELPRPDDLVVGIVDVPAVRERLIDAVIVAMTRVRPVRVRIDAFDASTAEAWRNALARAALTPRATLVTEPDDGLHERVDLVLDAGDGRAATRALTDGCAAIALAERDAAVTIANERAGAILDRLDGDALATAWLPFALNPYVRRAATRAARTVAALRS